MSTRFMRAAWHSAALIVVGCLLPEVTIESGPGSAGSSANGSGGTASEAVPSTGAQGGTAAPNAPPAPSCTDDVQNQNESDRDCGGLCEPCTVGLGCASVRDCALGLLCSEDALECVRPECTDKIVNGNEVGIDCGGGSCPGCPMGTPCNAALDCASTICDGGVCAGATCSDGVTNQNESDVDCGGTCGSTCPTGDACTAAADCASSACSNANCRSGVLSCCQAPSCTDGVINGGEPVVDCGNVGCGLCSAGHVCNANAQCLSGVCQDSVCTGSASCSNDVTDGTETDRDCGGTDVGCARCADSFSCLSDGDCQSGRCFAGICISCADGVRNGNETDVDCGGSDSSCTRCVAGDTCSIGGDCASNSCAEGADGTQSCCGGSTVDCTRCAKFLSIGQQCVDAPDQTGQLNCVAFLQCLADNASACPTRNAPGCSGGPGAACNLDDYGGAMGSGIAQANRVLQNAGCQL